MSRSFGDRELKKFVIAEPETHTYLIKASDDLLILSTDGLYKTFSVEYVAKRVYSLWAEGKMKLHEIANEVVNDCPCTDNVTLLIVSLHEYY